MTKLKKKTKNDINIKNMTKKWTKSIKINKKKWTKSIKINKKKMV